MTANEIRNQFFRFFESKGHQIVGSAPLVMKDDPTLLFTNAGMNPFKDIFLGIKEPAHKRVADTQKCLRVSGKHNDLEEVGKDSYHHTFFEMLGNWSFGDYFKEEAIAWAWELITEIYEIDKQDIYVTVFEGDQKEGLVPDLESQQLWQKYMDHTHILPGNKKDNFWEMGDTGPCGPCTEIHVDIRSDSEKLRISGRELVNKGNPLVIEIWNLVFIQFNRLANGSLAALTQKYVDTGMGLERLCMVMEHKQSNYDTDLFTPIIGETQLLTKKTYIIDNDNDNTSELDKKTNVAIRVIADHIRALVFAIADGQLPSNTGAGYVVRRILRRAVRYGYTFLEVREPLLFKLVKTVAETFHDTFPELLAQQNFLEKVIQEEETAFLRTLELGIRRFEAYQPKDGVVDGVFAFELFDTYGFPADLTELMAQEKGFHLDHEVMLQELEKQRMRSKEAAAMEAGDWIEVSDNKIFEFVGYDVLETHCWLVRYRKVIVKEGMQFQLVLDKTPFYAEGGGQVGDTGYLLFGDEKIAILNTKKENNQSLHFCSQLPKDPTVEAVAVVDAPRRHAIEKNHTATHLLQAALKKVLGTHVNQKGSLVDHDKLRFDFSHFEKVTDDEWDAIEKMVNEKIQENIPLNEQRQIPFKSAVESGATALFGEKYGDAVRVVAFDPTFSRELCGGTHVPSTGKIGFFKLTHETAVASGVRRMEAVTGMVAVSHVQELFKHFNSIKSSLTTTDPLKAINELISENSRLLKTSKMANQNRINEVKTMLISKKRSKEGIQYIIEKVDLPDQEAIKTLSFELKKEISTVVVVLGSLIDEKPFLSVLISNELTHEKKFAADQLVKVLAKEIGGGGGGQSFYATAGGKNRDGLDNAIVQAVTHFGLNG